MDNTLTKPLALSEFSQEAFEIHINSPMSKICLPKEITEKNLEIIITTNPPIVINPTETLAAK